MFERSARTAEDRRLLSGAYYVVGDIHDFNGAPRAAISAYRRSLRFDPSEAAAWREIGGMLDRMGHRTRAAASGGAKVALRAAMRDGIKFNYDTLTEEITDLRAGVARHPPRRR